MFRGHIAKMLRHKHAAEVIELLYNDYATAAQRALILQEAYGHQFALQLTSNNVQKLEEAIALNPEKRQVILGNLNDLLVTMVSKCVPSFVPIIGDYSYIKYPVICVVVELLMALLPWPSFIYGKYK